MSWSSPGRLWDLPACVPTLLPGHRWYPGICVREHHSLRDSTDGCRGRQGKGAGEQVPVSAPAPFCQHRFLLLTEIQPNHRRVRSCWQWCHARRQGAKPRGGRHRVGMKQAARDGAKAQGELLGPTAPRAVSDKPRCSQTFQWLIVLCTAPHHRKRSFLPCLTPITHPALGPSACALSEGGSQPLGVILRPPAASITSDDSLIPGPGRSDLSSWEGGYVPGSRLRWGWGCSAHLPFCRPSHWLWGFFVAALESINCSFLQPGILHTSRVPAPAAGQPRCQRKHLPARSLDPR